MSNNLKKESDLNRTWWKADFVTLSLTGHIADITRHFPLQITYQTKSNYPAHMGAFIRKTEDVTTKLHQWHKEKETAIAALVAYSKSQVLYHQSLLDEKLALDEALAKNIEEWTKPLDDKEEPVTPPTNIPHIPVSPSPYEPRYDDLDTVHGADNLHYNPRPSRNFEEEK